MTKKEFDKQLSLLKAEHEKLITRKNVPVPVFNGIYQRYEYPVITAEHTPFFWRFDLDFKTNPFLQERHQRRRRCDV